MAESENVILTAQCMIYENDKILVQNKVSGWIGLTFPGGHIEKEESFVLGIKREIFEETGLTIENPVLCGIKQFQTKDNIRYIVLYFKTNQFSGDLKSSDEGEMMWLHRDDLNKDNVAPGFMDSLKVFYDDTITELVYERRQDGDAIKNIVNYYS